MVPCDHLARALAVRAITREQPDETIGAALAVLRADAMTGVHDHHPAASGADTIRADIMSLSVPDMPPPSDLVAILLETISQRHGGISRGMVWRSIGVNPHRGRDLLTRSASTVDWPLWYTLREAALGDER